MGLVSCIFSFIFSIAVIPIISGVVGIYLLTIYTKNKNSIVPTNKNITKLSFNILPIFRFVFL